MRQDPPAPSKLLLSRSPQLPWRELVELSSGHFSCLQARTCFQLSLLSRHQARDPFHSWSCGSSPRRWPSHSLRESLRRRAAGSPLGEWGVQSAFCRAGCLLGRGTEARFPGPPLWPVWGEAVGL